MNPLQTGLSRTPWAVFVTLTYESRSASGQPLPVPLYWIRRRMLFQWLRKISKAFNVPFEVLLWVAREERGEERGRFHWHVLVAGLHYSVGRGIVPSPNPTSDKHRLENLWRQCGKSAGFPDVRPYDARLSGVEYIMKGLNGFDHWNPQSANQYELGKFDDELEERSLIVAPAWYRYISMRSRNRRHSRAAELKIVKADRSGRGQRKQAPAPKRFPHFADTGIIAKKKRSKTGDWTWKPGYAAKAEKNL